MDIVLFLLGTILFVLGVIALIRPMPRLWLGSRKAAAGVVVLSLGSCVAGGLVTPTVVQGGPSSPEPAVKARPAIEGVAEGSEAERVLNEFANMGASEQQRAELRALRTDDSPTQKWPGLPDVALGNCAQQGERDLMCVTSQINFISTWPDAFAGDYSSQRDVAFCYKTGCDGAVMTNPIQACAWRGVIAASGSPYVDSSDAEALQRDCGALSPADRVVAQAQADRLSRLI